MLAGCSAPPAADTCAATAPPRPEAARRAKVARVVDGDTIIVDGDVRVRLLGINTPESVDPRRPPQRFGREAAEFARRHVEGAEVFLLPGRTPKDEHGRALAWVWLQDGRFFNGELVRLGYARVNTWADNPDHADYLQLCQREARQGQRGMWRR